MLSCLARYFGPAALSPRDYFEQDWGAERFSEGCIPTLPQAGDHRGGGQR